MYMDKAQVAELKSTVTRIGD